jgi:hypothetical protein
MRTRSYAFLSLTLLLSAFTCDDDESASKHTIKYEVITSSGKWSGEYEDEHGDRINLPNVGPVEEVSGWTYSFTPDSIPYEAHVFAEASCPECDGTRDPSPDCTVNIYVDDKLVVSETNKWAKGVTSGTHILN